jgi:hypothetical protein
MPTGRTRPLLSWMGFPTRESTSRDLLSWRGCSRARCRGAALWDDRPQPEHKLAEDSRIDVYLESSDAVVGIEVKLPAVTQHHVRS